MRLRRWPSVASIAGLSYCQLLSGKNYFFGDQPCSLDASIYAFFAQFILTDLDTPLGDIVKKHESIVRYCERFHAAYYQQ
ncbi:MAG: hypothetical protein COA42_09520 [Alteromonadaceae bacterium]|nr:MAG: hypothetical protein COA42_09520 [Alteromonadaceae bacterium]